MHIITHDGMYDLALAAQAFIAILQTQGVLDVREHLQALMVRLNEEQIADFDVEKQLQIDLLKDIDLAVKHSKVAQT